MGDARSWVTGKRREGKYGMKEMVLPVNSCVQKRGDYKLVEHTALSNFTDGQTSTSWAWMLFAFFYSSTIRS
jgi:hypothetical protein